MKTFAWLSFFIFLVDVFPAIFNKQNERSFPKLMRMNECSSQCVSVLSTLLVRAPIVKLFTQKVLLIIVLQVSFSAFKGVQSSALLIVKFVMRLKKQRTPP